MIAPASRTPPTAAGQPYLLQPSSPRSKSNRTRVPPSARTPSTPSIRSGYAAVLASRTNPVSVPDHLKCSINIRSASSLTSRLYRKVRPSGDTAKPDGSALGIEPLQLRDAAGRARGRIQHPHRRIGIDRGTVRARHVVDALRIHRKRRAGDTRDHRPRCAAGQRLRHHRRMHGLRDVEQRAAIRRLACDEAAAARDALGRPGPDPHPPDVAAVASRPREVDPLAVARPCRGHLIAGALRDLARGSALAVNGPDVRVFLGWPGRLKRDQPAIG